MAQTTLKFEALDAAGRLVRKRRVPLFTRYTFRDELQDLLGNVGFRVVHLFRDYNRNQYDGTGEMIVVAQRLDQGLRKLDDRA
ncbi:MAG TPA: hypothetical protein DEP84_15130 [Chloroflexi bacterium]|nr:hypothetical protein [Chloroflexota bacterium]